MIRQYGLLIAAAFIMAAGLWFAGTAVLQLREAAALQTNNIQTLATVSQKWILPDERANTSHRVRYSFAIENEDFFFERAVPPALFRVVESGSNFEVTASAENPELHEIYPGQLSGRARAQLVGGLLISGFGLVVFLLGGGMRLFQRKTADA